jgi:hypothetical protein
MGYIDILLNRKGFPIKVLVIGHSLLRKSCFHLPRALSKYILCDNKGNVRILDIRSFLRPTWSNVL